MTDRKEFSLEVVKKYIFGAMIYFLKLYWQEYDKFHIILKVT